MKPVLVTIDTEGHDGVDPISHLIFGETESGRYGIEYIMDEFDKANAKVLFFVDFAEAWDYGRDKVERVVRTILDRGHNVGVHIHPDHMADKNRLFLYEYSREEQYDMIKRCTELYTEIVGRPPKSFRAGKYGANHDTLDILSELGYKYDFSEFYHQKWCGIQPPITINAPCRYKNLVEFPVTMHQSVHIGPFVREDKLDIEQMTAGELKYALTQIAKAPFDMVTTLFFHSFSLLKWREQPDTPGVNGKNIEKLKSAVKAVAENKELYFITEADLDGVTAASDEQAKNSKIAWNNQFKGLVYTYIKALKIIKTNKKAKLLIISSALAVILVILAILALLL